MAVDLGSINWLAILACIVTGQILLSIWFIPLFGEAWAKEYGGEGTTRQQHTAEVPPYTYLIGAVCVMLLSIAVSVLQTALGVENIGGALQLAFFLATMVFIAMAMPAYAFLRRWTAFLLGAGSQVVVIFAVSIILVLWR